MPLWSPATIHFWMVVKLRFEFSEERFTAIGAKESWNPRELRAVLAQFDLLRLVTTKVTVSSRNAEFYETVCVRCEHPIDIDHPICGGCKFVPLWNADAVYGWFWINWDHNLSDSESASLRSQEFWNPGELYDRLTSLQLWPEVELIC
ncbi:MAG: hypothetical protein A2751_05330 [Candidatus Doudnabacteria bacterium RIFCSPHIGHO2_01_FULL_46_14]|uniref:Uncharacterized protein n=1 Tax=Candidatus Doudnabacteria bacterium RIFCSPHIGHO2_01_FULL_46_14 TaxID=1817824 RepID=A0A1F5NP19_9BACT|nr:MAG: hypothetical protein A2751_05330 [Candidatus Doudnabacteria bacterium RIFCSPHIGHO2_01_FULL_46_14]